MARALPGWPKPTQPLSTLSVSIRRVLLDSGQGVFRCKLNLVDIPVLKVPSMRDFVKCATWGWRSRALSVTLYHSQNPTSCSLGRDIRVMLSFSCLARISPPKHNCYLCTKVHTLQLSFLAVFHDLLSNSWLSGKSSCTKILRSACGRRLSRWITAGIYGTTYARYYVTISACKLACLLLHAFWYKLAWRLPQWLLTARSRL